jgi:tRNA/rRNA methyltransferase
MTFWAYLLRCNDASYYVGHTDNLDQRIGQHGTGELGGYTASRRPVQLAWSQEFATRHEALTAERQIKGWSRAKKEALIRGDWPSISRLASRAQFATDSKLPECASYPARPPRWREALSPPPAIILVRPQLGENIGKAARAMLNFGLTDLRLVAPRDGWPNPDAGPAASGADVVLANARVFASLAEAAADCAHLYATTVRKRGVTKPVLTPEAAARAIHADAGQSALVFGAERSGLASDDVALAHSIITVPINPEFGSLNLAQAVILCAYEWSKGMALAQPPAVALDPPAPHAELEELIGHFVRDLETAGYFFPADRKAVTLRALRTMLTKTGWSSNDVRMMHGVVSILGRARHRE